jgi:hypothetical protein
VIPLPDYARPIVGYMTWHLRMGKTQEQVMAKAQSHEDYAGFPQHVYDNALRQAMRNLQATDIAESDARANAGPHYRTERKGDVPPCDYGKCRTLGECFDECDIR